MMNLIIFHLNYKPKYPSILPKAAEGTSVEMFVIFM